MNIIFLSISINLNNKIVTLKQEKNDIQQDLEKARSNVVITKEGEEKRKIKGYNYVITIKDEIAKKLGIDKRIVINGDKS